MFNRFGTNLLCVAIAGSDRGEVRILNTYPDGKGGRPNNRYANRCLLLRDEILLVYFHQRLDNPDEEPQLWKLELGSVNSMMVLFNRFAINCLSQLIRPKFFKNFHFSSYCQRDR